jgi:hypothetical protein
VGFDDFSRVRDVVRFDGAKACLRQNVSDEATNQVVVFRNKNGGRGKGDFLTSAGYLVCHGSPFFRSVLADYQLQQQHQFARNELAFARICRAGYWGPDCRRAKSDTARRR